MTQVVDDDNDDEDGDCSEILDYKIVIYLKNRCGPRRVTNNVMWTTNSYKYCDADHEE